MAKLLFAVFVALVCCASAASPFDRELAEAYLARDYIPRRMKPFREDAASPLEREPKTHLARDYIPRRIRPATENDMWQYDDEARHPMEAMLKRGILPDFSANDVETFINTKRLLDAVLQDGGSIKGGDVIYRFGSGDKQDCVDGKKSIPAQCQWTGMVQWTGEDELTETKLSVAKKYCKIAGLEEPENKVVDC